MLGIGKFISVFEQIESDDYTDIEKIIAIDNVLRLETHNGIKKESIIKAFKWFYENEEEIVCKNNEWIPVSEQLPIEKINPMTDDYQEYIVTFFNDGKYDTRLYKFGKGHWLNSGQCMDKYVIAWQPLQEPYQKGGVE